MLKDRLMKFLKLDGLIDNLSGYVETRAELLKFEIKEDVGRLVAKVLFGLTLALTLMFFLILISFSLAFAIGEKLGTPVGFSIVAGFYLLVGVLLFLFRDPLNARLEKMIAEIMQKKNK